MPAQEYRPGWLKGYASATEYVWTKDPSQNAFTRRIGVIESLFDVDGTHFEGRADMNCDVKLEFRTSKHRQGLKEHISLAWAVLRHKHTLLSAQAINSAIHGNDRVFRYQQPRSVQDLLESGNQHANYLDDQLPEIDSRDFYQHLMNSSRAIDPEHSLSRLFVHPFSPQDDRPFPVQFTLVLAHQIADGLTIFRWVSSFIDLLNLSSAELHHRAELLVRDDPLNRLPPPQEQLYHPAVGSVARQRWFWAIARILRHVKRPSPAAFQNPLRRNQPLSVAKAFPPKYHALNYERTPPLNNYAIAPTLGRKSMERLAKLCRQAKVSIGSGLFTLVALVMMQFEEERHPEVALKNRLPFIGSFPVNPRPFLGGVPTTGKEDSLMLAFSDGIVLPFLPKDLPFEGRFRLLGRQTHRQLKQYQKRRRTAEEELTLGTKNPQQLLPALYMSALERVEQRKLPHERKGYDIQGAYPPTVGASLATCGISSVGDRTQMVTAGKYDTSKLSAGQEVVADFRDMASAVRARDGEFLCGAVSDKEKTYFMISVDSCAIDRGKAEDFKRTIESILEGSDVQPAKL